MAVVTMAKLMKSAGMGKITKLGKVIARQGDDVIREATFANGRVGTYRVSNFMGTKTQAVSDGQMSVVFNSTKGEDALCDVYLKSKGDYVELFPRKHDWRINKSIPGTDVSQRLATGVSTITPIRVESKLVNGKVKHKVLCNEEIHTSTKYQSENGFGTIYEYRDLLLSTQGKSMPIYKRPNMYVPANKADFAKDLSKNPIYGNPQGFKTRYTGQTPIAVLNNDLKAGFKSELNPIWSKLDEMFWKLA